MWHKPCRTFHPWCPCIKTRCLLVLSSHRIRNNQIKLYKLISRWKPFLGKMHMKKIHTVIRRTNDFDKWLVCVTYLKISDADLWFHCWTLSPWSWYLFAVYLEMHGSCGTAISANKVLFFSYETVIYMLPSNKHTKTRFVLANKSWLWYLE